MPMQAFKTSMVKVVKRYQSLLLVSSIENDKVLTLFF